MSVPFFFKHLHLHCLIHFRCLIYTYNLANEKWKHKLLFDFCILRLEREITLHVKHQWQRWMGSDCFRFNDIRLKHFKNAKKKCLDNVFGVHVRTFFSLSLFLSVSNRKCLLLSVGKRTARKKHTQQTTWNVLPATGICAEWH